MINEVPVKVLLPNSILEKRGTVSTDEFKQLVLDYMKRYPEYRILKVSKEFAICERVYF